MPQCSKRWRIFNVQARFNSSKSALKPLVRELLADRVRLSLRPNNNVRFWSSKLVPQRVCAKQDLKVPLNAHNKPLKHNKHEASKQRNLLALWVRKAHKQLFKQLKRQANSVCPQSNWRQLKLAS